MLVVGWLANSADGNLRFIVCDALKHQHDGDVGAMGVGMGANMVAQGRSNGRFFNSNMKQKPTEGCVSCGTWSNPSTVNGGMFH